MGWSFFLHVLLYKLLTMERLVSDTIYNVLMGGDYSFVKLADSH